MYMLSQVCIMQVLFEMTAAVHSSKVTEYLPLKSIHHHHKGADKGHITFAVWLGPVETISDSNHEGSNYLA